MHSSFWLGGLHVTCDLQITMVLEDYQSIVIMKSSPWQRERAFEFCGVPLQAIVLSLILHALVLTGLAPQFSAMPNIVPAAPVLQGVLLPVFPAQPPLPEHPAPVPQLVRPAVSPVVPSVVPPVPVLSSRVRQPAAAIMQAAPVTPAMAALPAAVQAPALVGSAGSNASGDSVPHATSGLATAATAALAQESDARGPDSAGLRQFRMSLAGEARRFRRYPEAARRAGLSGMAEIRITVEVGGLQRRADLGRSSGHALLDAAALEMLQQAATYAMLPESLRNRSFTVLLPVVFEVDE